MITDSEEFIKIQWLLALSNIPTTDCFKINALIIKLSKENQKSKDQQKEFILYLRHLSNWYSADGVKQGMVNEILQKYKEMLGDDK